MSIKTHIQHTKHCGAPVYLGEINGTDSYSSNPEKILEWLGNAWRTRYNQHRSKRSRYEIVTRDNGERIKVLLPIGSTVTDIKDSQARKDYSWLSAVPAMILQSPEKKENQDWWASIERRRTLSHQGKTPGRMPRFRSRKKHDNIFVCWHNKGANANYVKTGKRTGIVTITGRNPTGKKYAPGDKSSWKIKIRVKHTGREVPDYTSILVNITTQSLVFVCDTPMQECQNQDKIVGVDRGGVIPISTSDETIRQYDKSLLEKNEKKRKYHQRQMGKMISRSKKEGRGKAVCSGVKYRHHKERAAHYSRKSSAYKYAMNQQWTTELIRENGMVILEDLHVSSMTCHGGSRKRGMNRSFLGASPGEISKMLEYKAGKSGGMIAYVPPAYTSQRCSECGYTARENRESQAMFRCGKCGHTDNADVNAAKNIKWVYQSIQSGDLDWGTDLSPHEIRVNGNGVIVRLKPSNEDVLTLYGLTPADRSDVIDPGDRISV